jgi:hypothetical protein
LRAFVTGAAGFIGSNLIDNFSTGRIEFLNQAAQSPCFHLERGDLLDLPASPVFFCSTVAARPLFSMPGAPNGRTRFHLRLSNAKLENNGLGGSYGTERTAVYQMLPEMGPAHNHLEYPIADDSWQAKFQDFLEDIRLGRQPDPGIEAAQAALRVVETIYAREQDH